MEHRTIYFWRINESYFFVNPGLGGIRAESTDMHKGFGELDRPRTIGLSFGFTGDLDRAIGLSRRPLVGLPRGLTQRFKIHIYIFRICNSYFGTDSSRRVPGEPPKNDHIKSNTK